MTPRFRRLRDQAIDGVIVFSAKQLESRRVHTQRFHFEPGMPAVIKVPVWVIDVTIGQAIVEGWALLDTRIVDDVFDTRRVKMSK